MGVRRSHAPEDHSSRSVERSSRSFTFSTSIELGESKRLYFRNLRVLSLIAGAQNQYRKNSQVCPAPSLQFRHRPLLALLPLRKTVENYALVAWICISPVDSYCMTAKYTSPAARRVAACSTLQRARNHVLQSERRFSGLAKIAPCSSESCANKTDASLTLIGLSLLGDKAVGQLVFLLSQSQSLTNWFGGSLTWQDSCTFVAVRMFEESVRNKKERLCRTAASIQQLAFWSEANAVVSRYP